MLLTDRVLWENLIISLRGEETRLVLISDFDYTLTAFTHPNGAKVFSSVGCVREMEEMSLSYRHKAAHLYEQYIPYDTDPTLSFEERAEKMLEWWEHHYALMFKEGLSRDLLFRAGQREDFFTLREGARELLRTCAVRGVPCITLSAGLGEVIRGVFARENLLACTNIVSNDFLYDEQGRAYGVSAPIMHNYNKHTTARLLEAPLLAGLSPTHCVVLGDSVGDSKMATLFPEATVIRIGILGHHQVHMLPEYQSYFDALLFGNDGLTPVLDLLHAMGEPEPTLFSAKQPPLAKSEKIR